MNKVICTYNKEWISMFQEISDFLKQNIKTYIQIEHVGSTAIPGLDAKPIIDIDIDISSKPDFDKIKKELEEIGYFHCGDQGVEGREAFKRSGNENSILDKVTHHLYVCTSDNNEYKRHIVFRDKYAVNRGIKL